MTSLVVSVPTVALRDAVDHGGSDVTVVDWDMSGPAPSSSIDLVVVPYMSPVSVLTCLESVATRLVQSQMIGFDGVAAALPVGVTFANAKGVHETATAELAMGLILAAQRGLADFVRDAALGRWNPGPRVGLADRTVLLVGYGGVGQALHARLLPFEVDVVRVARNARRDEHGVIHAIEEVHSLLGDADVVVVSVPLSDDTVHLIDEAFLMSMREGALLVNVARGPVADTQSLTRHATLGRVRLALDVVDPEPLAADHPLFALPNVLISPHVGGRTAAMLPRMARLILEQTDRLSRGLEPVNVVLRT